MIFDKLRRFDVQAHWAAMLSVVSVPPCVVAATLVIRRYHSDLGQIIYGSRGKFLPAFLVCALASMALAVVGLLLGWSSASQRRNDKPARSWIGFFLGCGVLSADVVMLIAFYMLRLEKPS
jgi:hypothetical protein